MGGAGEFGSMRHLAGRFFGMLWPGGPPAPDEAWAAGHLLPGERELWRGMSGPDRRHGVAVARETLRLLGQVPGVEPGRPVVACALLHDVGKVEARLGPFGRTAVTLAAIAFGRTRVIAAAPTATGRRHGAWRARAGLYLTHDRVGADLLRRAGADPMTVSWSEQHHLSPARWTVDPRIGAALKAADDD